MEQLNKIPFARSPTLETVLMVEKTIESNSGSFNRTELWKNIPRKIMWQTYLVIINYLEKNNKIIVDNDGKIIWIWNPALISTLERKGLIIEEDLINKMKNKTKNNNRRLGIKEIVETLKNNHEEIKMYSVDKLGIFGSYTKGKQKEKSDIDFLVSFEKTNFDNYIGLKLFLEKLFKRKIDLVVERTLKPDFKYVKKEAIYV